MIWKKELWSDDVMVDGVKTKAESIKAIEEAIRVYNTRRLHEKLGFKTPKAFREEAMRKAA